MKRSVRPEARAGQTGIASTLQVRRLDDLSQVPDAAWTALNVRRSPFLERAFLSQLETRGLVGPGTGWRPRHLLASRAGKTLAALPLYEKSNSFGEFVFDWAWADAYLRAGRQYFPKLVCAVPFTPVPGQRCLAASQEDAATALPALLLAARELAYERGASSLHVLFADENQAEMLVAQGLEPRADCRFVWKNQGFEDFDDFLATFNSRQRKNIRSERRKVRAAGVGFEWITGDALRHLDWAQVHELCAHTFRQRGHMPYLDAGFFAAMARNMPDRLLVNLAKRDGETVAAAVFFRDRDTLYGRYWGAVEQISCLHFESCYYQGIEYAIKHRLRCFDPGTQGEHKLRRGFSPVPSWSLHWFTDEQFGNAIARWLVEERRLVREYIEESRAAMPFRTPAQEHEYWP